MSRIIEGDCRDVMRILLDEGVALDSCVTDPPYGLAFMGKDWDHAVPGVDYWRPVYDLLKPGAHLFAFGGTRTYHRLVCAIEDAGFEIRDQYAWVYGSGFPKSHNLKGDWQGWGTTAKPAWEPICLARKPLDGTVAANVLKHGTGALNIDGCRVGTTGARNNGRKVDSDIYGKLGPFERVDYDKGRWPANLIHDGSDEVLACFPDAPGQMARARTDGGGKTNAIYGALNHVRGSSVEPRGDSGSAARFFYCAKATKKERCGSKHPTVKPLALMRWLCRLVTPPGGTVLDPFAGTGTTLRAAREEGFSSIGVEMNPEYVADIHRRMTA